jgi:hypothetical protein
MNVLEYLEDVLLFFKELLCKSSLLSILELCSTLTFVVHGVYFGLLCNTKVLVHNIWYQSIQS